MGLDMYLSKKTYIGNNYRDENERIKIITPKVDNSLFPIKTEIKEERIVNIEERVGYWRKANQIHKWFVENIQNGEDDCREYYVDKSQLKQLFDICKEVLENKENIEKVKELLPIQKGFFFGSYDYDEYYFEDIENTIKIIEPLLEEEGKFYYQSSW